MREPKRESFIYPPQPQPARHKRTHKLGRTLHARVRSPLTVHTHRAGVTGTSRSPRSCQMGVKQAHGPSAADQSAHESVATLSPVCNPTKSRDKALEPCPYPVKICRTAGVECVIDGTRGRLDLAGAFCLHLLESCSESPWNVVMRFDRTEPPGPRT